MGWIPEGSYKGVDPASGAKVELRFDRGGDGRNVVLASGDVRLGDGTVLSFVSKDGALTTDAAGAVRGGAWLYSTGMRRGEESPLLIEPGSDGLDVPEVTLGVTFDIGAFNVRLGHVGALSRSITLKIDRLSRAPKPPPEIFAKDGTERTLGSCLAAAGIVADFGEIGVIEEEDDFPFHTAAELHDMMQTFGKPPTDLSGPWWLHVMLARQFSWTNAEEVTGVLYDVEGRKQTPDRQGVAVFLESPGIASLAKGAAADPERWRDEILFTLVHEIGHGLNLPHSFENDRAEALTWMNYPDKVAGGAAAFWENFTLAFDARELCYLRHAPSCDIAPGRRRYADRLSDLIARTDPNMAALRRFAIVCEAVDEPRAELSVTPLKEPAHYAYGEPIFLKVSIRNVGKVPFVVPRALDPTDGLIAITVVGPDGQGRAYRPPLALCQKFRDVPLRPGKSISFDGVFVGFDADGPLFETPGRYRIEASFSGLPGPPLIAEPCELRVFYPTRAEEALAVRLWDDRDLMRAIYYRQPLLARDAWGGLLRAHEKAARNARPGDTSLNYLKYVGAMGYAEPFRPAGREGFAENATRCAQKLKALKGPRAKPRNLPQGVLDRIAAGHPDGKPKRAGKSPSAGRR